ncbi:MAG: anion permease [Alphaproteobacteria bacterium]|nr:anion permease [Alphaproteobacteria bacterium]
MRRAAIAAVIAAVAIFLALPALPFAQGWLEPAQARAAGLVLLTLGFWALVVLPEFTTALIFFLVAMVLHVAPPQAVFAGFSSAAWWLVFGGLIVGAGVERTGLGRRLARAMFGRLGASYAQAVAAVALAAVALAFLMPSTMGRVVLLMPIVLALADRLGFPAGSRGRVGLVMTAALGTYVPATGILPASVPTSVLIGAAEQLYGIRLTYGPYLLLHFPVLGLGYLAILVPVVARLFHDTPRPQAEREAATAMSRDERVLGWVLAVALLGYALDFLHGVSPAWVSLAAGLACLLPGIAIVSPKLFSERVNLAVLIYVAAIIGIGGVVEHTGLGTRLGALLIQVAGLAPGASAYDFGAIVVLCVLIGLATTVIPIPAILGPLAGDIAAASGLPLLTVLMIYVIGFAVILLPYQSGPLVVAMQLGGVSARQGMRLTLIMGGATVAVLAPLAYLWWRALGRIG